MEGRGSDIDFSFYLFCYVFKRLVFPWNKYKLMYTIAGDSRKKKKKESLLALKAEREGEGWGWDKRNGFKANCCYHRRLDGISLRKGATHMYLQAAPDSRCCALPNLTPVGSISVHCPVQANANDDAAS